MQRTWFRCRPVSVVDPGFPVGGGVNSRGGYTSKMLYVKTKESGPLGGVRWVRPLDPPMPVPLSTVLHHCEENIQ